MDFRPKNWKIIISLILGIFSGLIVGKTGLGFNYKAGFLAAAIYFIFAYLIGSLVQKKK